MKRPYEVAVCPGPLCTNERPFIEFISEILKRNDDLLFFDSVTVLLSLSLNTILLSLFSDSFS